MCFVRRYFVTYGPHCCTICSFYLTQQHLAFVLIRYGHIVHVVLLSEINDYYYYYYYYYRPGFTTIQHYWGNECIYYSAFCCNCYIFFFLYLA